MYLHVYQEELLDTQKTKVLKNLGLELYCLFPQKECCTSKCIILNIFLGIFSAFYITSCYRGDF